MRLRQFLPIFLDLERTLMPFGAKPGFAALTADAMAAGASAGEDPRPQNADAAMASAI
jgi:hypothetical protein